MSLMKVNGGFFGYDVESFGLGYCRGERVFFWKEVAVVRFRSRLVYNRNISC